jgi:DnaJ-domain-containing protein 1
MAVLYQIRRGYARIIRQIPGGAPPLWRPQLFESLSARIARITRETRSAYLEGRYGWREDALEALDVLGLGPDADSDAIRRRFHELSRQSHPDAPEGDHERFLRIRSAYDVLKSACKTKEPHE